MKTLLRHATLTPLSGPQCDALREDLREAFCPSGHVIVMVHDQGAVLRLYSNRLGLLPTPAEPFTPQLPDQLRRHHAARHALALTPQSLADLSEQLGQRLAGTGEPVDQLAWLFWALSDTEKEGMTVVPPPATKPLDAFDHWRRWLGQSARWGCQHSALALGVAAAGQWRWTWFFHPGGGEVRQMGTLSQEALARQPISPAMRPASLAKALYDAASREAGVYAGLAVALTPQGFAALLGHGPGWPIVGRLAATGHLAVAGDWRSRAVVRLASFYSRIAKMKEEN